MRSIRSWSPASSLSRGFSARARLTNSSAAGARASGVIASSCSPATRSGARLVAMTFTRGDAASSRATSAAAPSTCSKLSSTSRTERSARCAASASKALWPSPSVAPSAWASAGTTRSGSSIAPSGTKRTPSSKLGSASGPAPAQAVSSRSRPGRSR